jgi:two-component system, cell cycle sensor histidine kinase and response regulator CckA
MSSAAEPRRETSLRSMLELVPVLYWETDAALRLTALEGMALRAMGVAAADFLGRPVTDFLFPDSAPPEARRAHERALAGDSAVFDLALHGRDLRVTTRGWTGPNGVIDRVAGMALDLTERIFAERALRLSEHGYRTLMEEAPYAIARCTTGGELLQVNRAMTEMLGYDVDAAPELLLLDFPVIFSPEGSYETFRGKLVSGEQGATTDCAWLRRDGSGIQVRVTGRLVGEPGRPGAYLDVFAEDVTEKKRLEAELSDAQRMQSVGQLAGGVAHDFNNLLTVIGGHVELLLADAREPEDRERLDEVKQATDKAADLTRQLLAFGRRQVLHSRVVNLNKVIGKLMGMLRRLIKENVELRFEAGDALATVKADPNEIERVLLNLAINAHDAMPLGGVLTIETANVRVEETTLGRDMPSPGDYVRILVRDTGVGMDRETRTRAFEPFFTTKHASEGSGLGLAVVYGVIRQSGGHISLESEPGAGTVFRIYLPRADTADAPAADAPAALAALPGGNETILFAEDDRAIRMLISRVLEKLGYRVLAAPDGAAGIELAHAYSGEIHLLLSDIIMPSLGGHELAERLKAEKPELKVVFISGYAGHQLAATELETGGVCFLQKPVPMDVLANTIRGVLDGYLP